MSSRCERLGDGPGSSDIEQMHSYTHDPHTHVAIQLTAFDILKARNRIDLRDLLSGESAKLTPPTMRFLRAIDVGEDVACQFGSDSTVFRYHCKREEQAGLCDQLAKRLSVVLGTQTIIRPPFVATVASSDMFTLNSSKKNECCSTTLKFEGQPEVFRGSKNAKKNARKRAAKKKKKKALSAHPDPPLYDESVDPPAYSPSP